MNNLLQSNVKKSLQGDQEAFAVLVTEHQSLICSLTYAACGNAAKSEDLAQETFILAWKNLIKLKDPSLFKSWLCGIARNVIRKAFRSPTSRLENQESSDDTLNQLEAEDLPPSESASKTDDSALVWATLEQLPENYRIPLILYYREEHSTERVSELLELSQETTRQRLSRGRALLKQEVAKQVEQSLFQTLPTNAFTLAVVSALPAFACTGMAAAGIGTSTAKGSAWLFGISLSAFLKILLGPLIGLLGGWFGYKMSMKAAKSEEERSEIKKMSLWVFAFIAMFGFPLLTVIYLRTTGTIVSDQIFIMLIMTVCAFYGIGLFALIFYFNNRLAKVRQKAAKRNPAQLSYDIESYDYRTKSGFLGLPWIHIHRGSVIKGKHQKTIAKGWIAIGDIAVSPFFAAGSIAIAPLAFGAMAFGGLAFGGLAVGGLAAGGFAAGWVGVGGFALGYEAVGGIAMAWNAAFGGIALAHEFAVGGTANAMEANTAIADAWFKSKPFLNSLIYNVQYRPWIWYVVGFSPMIVIGFSNIYKHLFMSNTGNSISGNEWVIECPKCHKAHPLKTAGGFRFKARSWEKRTLGFCRSCRGFRWMKIRFMD